MNTPLGSSPIEDGPLIALEGASVPRARRDVVAVTLDGEAVIHRAGRVHALDPVATLVWRCCDGEASIDEIADELAEVFAMPTSIVRRDVTAVVEELATLELLTGNDATASASPDSAVHAGVPVPELLTDPPGSCASCAEKVWLTRTTYEVGSHLISVGGDDTNFDDATRAALARHVVPTPMGGESVPPFFGTTGSAGSSGSDPVGGPQPLHLLHRGDRVVARCRRADHLLLALVGYLATYTDLGSVGLATVRGLVVAHGDRAMIVAEPADPIRFRRELSRLGALVADLPVAVVDPERAEVVVGAPGLTVEPAAITALATETAGAESEVAVGGEAGVGAGDGPEPLPWGRYRLVALGIDGPASRSAALLRLGPMRGDPRDADASFAALLALLDAVPVVEAVDADAISAFLGA